MWVYGITVIVNLLFCVFYNSTRSKELPPSLPLPAEREKTQNSLLLNSLYFIKKDQATTAFNLLHCFDPSKDQSQLKNKEKELKKLSDLLVKLEQTSQADSSAVQAAQDHFHAVSAGLSSNEGGEDKTLADQVMSMFTCAPVLNLNDKL